MPVLLPTVLSVVSPGVAFADGASTVRLPVLKSQLDSDATCAAASPSTARTALWEQQALEMDKMPHTMTGRGVKVAVVDTGVSSSAAELAGRVSGPGTDDCVGHGTFVAGLIAAAPVQGVHMMGLAPGASVIGVRGTDERGHATADSVAQAIRAAVDAKADIVDVSLALTSDSAGLRGAVAYATKHDALVIAPAVPDPSDAVSSSSPPPPRAYWPAASPGVLSVLDVNVNGQRPDNPTQPLEADLVAPGDGVVGIATKGKGHFIGTGPSLAAGYTAGAAALVRSAFPDLSAAEVAHRLTSTAYPADVPRLDPFGALMTLHDSDAARGEATAAPVSMPKHGASAQVTRRAMLVAAGGGALVLVVAWAALVIPRGRARKWRPAND